MSEAIEGRIMSVVTVPTFEGWLILNLTRKLFKGQQWN